MVRGSILVASAVVTASAMKCPGSGAWLGHAKTQVTATAAASCADVHAEITARAQNSNDKMGWIDPHNGGIYSILSDSSPTYIETKRTTNPKHAVGGMTYTDKQSFTLTEADGKCTIEACSESQGSSLKDFSTNYCDIRNLYCGSADGCKPVGHDFATTQTSVDASSGQADFSACIVKPSVSATVNADEIALATFDGAKGTTHTWKENNDPVMGGKSTGTTTISGGMLVFDGHVAIVPSLKAPGFITSQVDDGLFSSASFPDVTGCKGVALTVNSKAPYLGYRFCFGKAHASGGKFFAYGYKSRFDAPVGKFGTVQIPFTNFTDFWDDATGNPIKTCQESPSNCPDKDTLKNMKTMAVWGEGVEGTLHLEVQKISAYGCAGSEPVKTMIV